VALTLAGAISLKSVILTNQCIVWAAEGTDTTILFVQALLFHQARRFALSLQGAPAVMKFWRPSILLLVQENSPALVAFCHDLKKGGLLILGRAVRDGGGELGTDSPVMRAQEEKARLLQVRQQQGSTRCHSTGPTRSGAYPVVTTPPCRTCSGPS
jgi:hypothetical protein